MFGGGSSKEQEEMKQKQFLDSMEENSAKMVEEWNQIQGNIAERTAIPNIVLSFRMKELKLTLITDVEVYKGLMLSSKSIVVDLYMYDSTNKYNKRSMELSFKNESYGVDVVEKNQKTNLVESSPFMQQLMMDERKDTQKLGKQFGQALELKVG